jgi:thioredoxin-like negative regulator of GroEL
LAPSIDKLLDEYKGKILIYRVDVDKDRALAEKMHIQAMPTLLFFDMKNTKSQSVGYMSYDELKREAIARLSLK